MRRRRSKKIRGSRRRRKGRMRRWERRMKGIIKIGREYEKEQDKLRTHYNLYFLLAPGRPSTPRLLSLIAAKVDNI